MVPVLSRSREFSLFLDGTGTGTGKNWSRKKVPVPVPEKISPGKKYRYRYRKNLVPEKSTGPGTGKNSGYRHTLVGWLASFTLGRGVSEKASTEDVLFVEEIEGIPSIEMLGGLLLLLSIIYQDSRYWWFEDNYKSSPW